MLTSGTYSYHNSTVWDEFSLGVLFILTWITVSWQHCVNFSRGFIYLNMDYSFMATLREFLSGFYLS
jgi:hypothetical protein